MIEKKENTPLDKVYRWEAEFPSTVFLRQSLGDGAWESHTWKDTMNRARKICSFIKSQGLSEGDRVGIWSANSADWIIVDLGIMMAGCISVPLYASQDKEASRFIVQHSELKILFLGAFDHMSEMKSFVPANVITVAIRGFVGEAQHELASVLKTFDPYEYSPKPSRNTPFTIIYSSGTTGKPKGVLHAYRSLSSTMDQVLQQVNVRTYVGGDQSNRARLFSYLPLSHVAERLSVEMNGIYSNAEISFSAGLDSFTDEIRSVQPTFLFSVPRLWTLFKVGVDAQIAPAAQKLLSSAEKARIRHQLGLGSAEYLASAAAPLSPELHNWYLNMGLPLFESYSMTETFGIGTLFRSDELPAPGSVGKGGKLTEVRISESGEIELRNNALMLGYYKNQAATDSVISNGWYKTGDTGYLDSDDRLWISGRVGSVFKTSKGKFVHPEKIEEVISPIMELEQIMVFGHGLDQPILIANLSEHGQTWPKIDITNKLLSELDAINSRLAPYERINQVLITKSEWTVESGLITPTLKIKRKKVESHYQNLIKQNAEETGVIWE